MRRSLSVMRRVLHHEWIVEGKLSPGGRPANADDKSTVVFLHGLLGSGKNLRAPAKKLTERHPHLSALMLDSRGHGKSSTTSFEPPHNLESAARDVIETVQHLGVSPWGVVGHSFGGRVALEYLRIVTRGVEEGRGARDAASAAAAAPLREGTVLPPERTWMLDCVPGTAHGSVARVLEAVSSVPLPIASKKDLVTYLTNERGIDPAIAAWMTTNLDKTRGGDDNAAGDGFDFAFDLDVVQSLIEDFPNQDYVEILNEVHSTLATTSPAAADADGRKYHVNVVRAGKNDAWTEDVVGEFDRLEEAFHESTPVPFRTHVLEDAGHWVHVDDLEGLLDMMDSSFAR